jgi:hypothetical protein
MEDHSMGSKELRVNALELNRVGITCPTCKSEIVFDCESQRGPTGAECPGCGVMIQEAIALVRTYREFFRMCSHLKDKVTVSLLVKLDV